MTVHSNAQSKPRAACVASTAACLLLFALRASAQMSTDAIRLAPAEGADGDNFGASVAIHANVAAIGAPLSDAFGTNAGAVCVFELHEDTQTWVQTATIAPDNLANFAFAGRDVALEGDKLIVGSPESPTIDDWPNDPAGNPESNKGAAYVFELAPGTGEPWTLAAPLTASDGAFGDDFGRALALAGDTIAVAAPGHFAGTLRTGTVYLFAKDEAAGTWQESQALLPPQLIDLALFGTALDLYPGLLAVGAPGAFFSPDNAGAVHIFEQAAPPFSGYTHRTELIGSESQPGDRFGEAVAVTQNLLAAGSVEDDGTVYVFARSDGGADWLQVARLQPDPPAPTAGFGQSVAFDGERLIVGAPFDGESGSGAAYVFSRGGPDGTAWYQIARVAFDELPGARLGFTVSANQGRLLMGAPLAADVDSIPGAAFVVDTPADSDGDGEADTEDNCTLAANGRALPDAGGNSQRDSDADGYGNVCDADFNNDCVVDFEDLAAVRTAFFIAGDSNEDIDGDGNVNFTDLGLLKAGFFAPPGPSGISNQCEPGSSTRR